LVKTSFSAFLMLKLILQKRWNHFPPCFTESYNSFWGT
jgi:hypothetical protein